MKHEAIRPNRSADAIDRVAPPARRAHPKLALVRPIVVPDEAVVATPAMPRPSFESAALSVMVECQRFTFHR